jgi:aminoglycoside 6-adenylyltransferase
LRIGADCSGKENTVSDHKKTYDIILSNFTSWARTEPAIRLAFLVGSRARNDRPADEWSDMDIVMATFDTDKLLMNSDWLTNIDEPEVIFNETTPTGDTERRVLFECGMDVDFVIIHMEKIKAALDNGIAPSIINRGVKVIIDKDALAGDLKAPDKFVPENRLPGYDEFLNTANDFWFHSVWTAKKMRRGEFLQAKSCCDSYMKQLLMKMLRWQAYCKNGIEYDTWHDFRFLEKWVDPSVLQPLKNAFAHYDSEDIWDALFVTMNIFREVSRETAAMLKYDYPCDADDFVSDYTRKLYTGR